MRGGCPCVRHRVYGRHLGRNKDERTSLFKSLVRSLVISEKIETTEAKAKAIKGLVDKLITQAKSKTTVRLVNQFLTGKDIQDKLMTDILPRLSDRTSGYTSLVKVGRRAGDGSSIVRMSFMTSAKKESSSKKQESSEKTETEKEVVASTVEKAVEPKKSAPKAKKAVKKETK